MQIYDVSNLKIGGTYPQPLFHISGRKLLSASMQLTQQHVDALVRSGITQVFMADNARAVLDFAQTPANIIPVSSLVVGSTMESDLLTPDGVVIIQQNEQVEDHHIAALKDSGIDFLMSRPAADVEAIRSTLNDLARVVIGRLDSLIRRGEYLRAPEARDPFLGTINYSPTVEILNINAVQLLRRRLSSRLQPVYGMLETGKQPNHQVLLDITQDLLGLMRSEPRQFAQLALMTAKRDDYLPDHAISVAVLSMAIAAHMNLSLEMVKEVIMGALLFDVGMLVVPKRIRSSSGVLSDADRQRVQQHPIYSLTMMEQIPGLSPIPRMMGYQHHERLNGKGYPAQCMSGGISEFARIVSVADVFAATTNPRAYKSQKLPYGAMEELVHMAHKGLLEPRVIKALLAAIGLFPVGSYVLLSNNMTAQVVGANATKIDRPLIRPIVPGGNPNAAGLVDLANLQYNHIKIIRAVPAPTVGDAKVPAADTKMPVAAGA
jgi:HD-GYP domain-containing protein (c-di-GMP phosphodiesterase class II)